MMDQIPTAIKTAAARPPTRAAFYQEDEAAQFGAGAGIARGA